VYDRQDNDEILLGLIKHPEWEPLQESAAHIQVYARMRERKRKYGFERKS
jgi:hypothetical protein